MFSTRNENKQTDDIDESTTQKKIERDAQLTFIENNASKSKSKNSYFHKSNIFAQDFSPAALRNNDLANFLSPTHSLTTKIVHDDKQKLVGLTTKQIPDFQASPIKSEEDKIELLKKIDEYTSNPNNKLDQPLNIQLNGKEHTVTPRDLKNYLIMKHEAQKLASRYIIQDDPSQSCSYRMRK